MERRQFLDRLLIGSGSALILSSSLISCKKDDDNPFEIEIPPGGIILDLTESKNSSLLNPGGYIYTSGIIVANAGSDEYLALSSTCTHEACTVQFSFPSKKFPCPCHGSEYSDTGSVLIGPASAPLQKFSVTLSEQKLTIK